MAIRTGLTHPISDHEKHPEGTKWDEEWDDHTGLEVETFITEELKNLITGVEYIDNNLILHKANGETLLAEVSVIEPTYSYGVKLYGVDVNGTIYKSGNKEIVVQYTSKASVKLGVILYAISETTKITDMMGPFDLKVTYGTKSSIFKVKNLPYENCVFDSNTNALIGTTLEESQISWVDVTSLFNGSQKGKISVTVQKDTTIKDTLNIDINTQKVDLVYNNDIILNAKTMQFLVVGGTAGMYHVHGFNNGEEFNTASGSTTYTGLVPGLNQIIARAVYDGEGPSIMTDFINVDVIYTEGVTETTTAINGVSSSISNNGVVTLYQLTVYSPNKDSLKLVTYLDDKLKEESDTDKNMVKQEVINASAYNDQNKYSTSYQKYIELTGTNPDKYLMVEANGQYYHFYDVFPSRDGKLIVNAPNYKVMSVQPVDATLLPYQGISPSYSFDQSTGSANNIIVTPDYATAGVAANVNPALESSDGWKEENGRTLFRLSAQEAPLYATPFDPQLQTQFSIELGFKTYNVSDLKAPIMTIGDFQLRPTSFCYNTENEKLFKARDSQFQSEQEVHLMITVEGNKTLKKGDTYYPDYLKTYQDLFDNAVEKLSYNIMRIYINGTIDRVIVLEDAEFTALRNAKLQFNPQGADIDLFMLRIYSNSALPMDAVPQNYISFLKTKEDKENYRDLNDIIGDNGEISYTKCYGKYNTIVYVLPAGCRFPNRAWGKADGEAKDDMKSYPMVLMINYADPDINKTYGGKFIDLQMGAQGSSAMRYLIWNGSQKANKFKDKVVKADGTEEELVRKSKFIPFSDVNFDQDTNRFTEDAQVQWNGFYKMPNYDGQKNNDGAEIESFVGKVNFASSMQAHKPGACRLFDDAYNAAVRDLKTLTGGRKAVNEEPFLYFYWESDLTAAKSEKLTEELAADADYWKKRAKTEIQSVDPADLLDNPNVRFMGFQTWGSAKKDKPTSGYDKNKTPGYMLIEGGENTEPLCNFKTPWHATQRAEQAEGGQLLGNFPVCDYEYSLANPHHYLKIDDESIVEYQRGAWDLDFGQKDGTDAAGQTYYYIDKKAVPTLKFFREFHDFNYTYDYTFKETTLLAPDYDSWNKDIKFKRCLTVGGDFVTKSGKYTCKKGDLVRFDQATLDWVPAGVSYNLNTKQWDSLNVFDITEHSNNTTIPFDAIREEMKSIFKEGILKYIDKDDIAFHLAFIKFLSGTDNRAKNTYYQIIGDIYMKNPDYDKSNPDSKEYIKDPSKYDEDGNCIGMKIRFFADDLDTILLTDNNGLQSKAYNLLEDSYKPASEAVYKVDSYTTDWGDAHNVFFYMFDQCYEADILRNLKTIIDTSFNIDLNVNNDDNYFCKQFFGIQKYFPSVAYNHTSVIYYENAKYVYASECMKGIYGNNGIDPIEQAHGSCLQAEREFMNKRLNFLATYAESSKLGAPSLNTAASAGSGASTRLQIKMIPYQDFYPLMQWELNTFVNLKDNTKIDDMYAKNQFAAVEKLVKADQEYELNVNQLTGTTINQGLYNVDLYKKLDITGYYRQDLVANFAHMTDLEIDNSKLYDKNGNMLPFYGDDYPILSLGSITASLPVLEHLNLRHLTLPETLDLRNCTKLQTLDITGTNVKNIRFPETGRFKEAIVPASLTDLSLYDNPGLKTIDFENVHNLQNVYVQCDKVGEFNIEKLFEDISSAPLKSLTLRGLDNNMTEATLNSLMGVANVQLVGHINIVDAEGNDAPISFNTLQDLVDKFGNIKDVNNQLYITFVKVATQTVKAPSTLAIYGNGSTATISPVIDGNDVNIVPNGSKFRLDISYKLVTDDDANSSRNLSATIATIDPITGVITLVAENETVAYAHVLVNTESGKITTSKNAGCRVTFKWIAPKVGDFAYADGSFSSSFITTKDLVGMVYATEPSDTSSASTGTAYIIGKEFAGGDTQSYMLGYSGDEGKFESSRYSVSAHALRRYITSVLNITDDYTGHDLDLATLNIMTLEITKASYEAQNLHKSTNNFSGRNDTDLIIDMVNTLCIPKLRSKYSKYANTNYTTPLGDGSYAIASVQAFEDIHSDLKSESVIAGDTKYNAYKAYVAEGLATAAIYPYFYRVHLYEPDCEVIDDYKQGKWYVPSLNLMQRIAYLRGASGMTGFSDPNAIRFPIDGTATGNEAIFSAAFALMKASKFPKCWQTIFGSDATAESSGIGTTDNVVTTQNATTNSNYIYTYSSNSPFRDTNYNPQSSYKWVAGQMPVFTKATSSYGSDYHTYESYPGSLYAWKEYFGEVPSYYLGELPSLSLQGHRCIPFTEITFNKPSA